MVTIQTNVATIQTNMATIQTNMAITQTNMASAQTNMVTAQTKMTITQTNKNDWRYTRIFASLTPSGRIQLRIIYNFRNIFPVKCLSDKECAECANTQLKPLLIWTSQFDGMSQSILHLHQQVARKLGYCLWSCERESMKSNYTGWSPLLLALMLWCCDASIVTPPPNCSDAHQLIKVARGHHTSSCNQGLCQDYKHDQIRSVSCSTWYARTYSSSL